CREGAADLVPADHLVGGIRLAARSLAEEVQREGRTIVLAGPAGGLAAADAPDPGADVSSLPVGFRATPDGEKGLLQHILDGGRGHEAAEADGEPRRVTLVKDTQGALVPGGDGVQQVVVRACVFGWWVRRYIRHLTLLWRFGSKRFR